MFKLKNKKYVSNESSDKSKVKTKIKDKEKYVQELLGIKNIEGNSIQTEHKESDSSNIEQKYYIRIRPKNINILMDVIKLGLIINLKKVLNASQETEILVVDKTERVDDNKNYLRELIERKENPIYIDLLQKDLDSLNEEFSRGASREFYIIIPYRNEREKEKIKQAERAVEQNDFDIIPTTKDDIKNMLQVYLERNFTNTVVKDFDV